VPQRVEDHGHQFACFHPADVDHHPTAVPARLAGAEGRPTVSARLVINFSDMRSFDADHQVGVGRDVFCRSIDIPRIRWSQLGYGKPNPRFAMCNEGRKGGCASAPLGRRRKAEVVGAASRRTHVVVQLVGNMSSSAGMPAAEP